MKPRDMITDAWLRNNYMAAFKDKATEVQTVWIDPEFEDGFRIRVTRTGTVSFHFRYRRSDGRREEIKLGRHSTDFTLKQARQKASVHRGKLADCREGEIYSPKLTRESIQATKTVEEIARGFIAWCKTPGAGLRPKTIEQYDYATAKVLIPNLGKFSMLDKSLRLEFRNLMDNMSQRASAASVFRVARRMGNWAIESELLEVNPFTRAIPPRYRPKYQRRRGFFEPEELVKLLQHLKAMATDTATAPGRRSGAIALVLLALTGARKSEIASSTWSEWHESSHMLRKALTKTGPEDKPVCDAALEALAWIREMPHRHHNWVCPAVTKDQPVDAATIYFVFCRIQQQLFPDKPRRIVHDLRRSFITSLKAQKVPLVMIAEILRHKTLAISSYYAQYQDKISLEVLEQSTSWMQNAMTFDPAELPPLPELSRQKPGPKPKQSKSPKPVHAKPESRYPTKDVLQQWVLQRPITEIARELHVSDKAVEKHCKRLGIQKPGRGYWAKKKAGIEVEAPI